MKIIIRVDANHKSGIGHLIRSLSLGQELINSGIDVICIGKIDKSLIQIRDEFGIDFIETNFNHGTISDLKNIRQFSRKINADWICLDGYNFSLEYINQLKSDFHLIQFSDKPLLSIYESHIVVDNNISPEISEYNLSKNSILLSGPKYICLRSSLFSERISNNLQPEQVKSLLITLGGSDPNNFMPLILDSIRKLSFLDKITVLQGPLFRNEKIISSFSKKNKKIEIIKNKFDISKYIINSDMVVSSAGTTAYEISAICKPMILIATVDNQIKNAKKFKENKLAFSIENPDEVTERNVYDIVKLLSNDKKSRIKFSNNMKSLFDSKGCNRIVNTILNY
ncbi:MAG: hypothetical protein CL780_02035 [Chloroflexi bacterium]|nr:hypothetical protein [Chloroflexota bacterium]|tara:strand:+ start:850 stop:1866 length:1017 start_codon:yes stop_codon:yes gene_type:complete